MLEFLALVDIEPNDGRCPAHTCACIGDIRFPPVVVAVGEALLIRVRSPKLCQTMAPLKLEMVGVGDLKTKTKQWTKLEHRLADQNSTTYQSLITL
jgi:hypothetical protein